MARGRLNTDEYNIVNIVIVPTVSGCLWQYPLVSGRE